MSAENLWAEKQKKDGKRYEREVHPRQGTGNKGAAYAWDIK